MNTWRSLMLFNLNLPIKSYLTIILCFDSATQRQAWDFIIYWLAFAFRFHFMKFIPLCPPIVCQSVVFVSKCTGSVRKTYLSCQK